MIITGRLLHKILFENDFCQFLSHLGNKKLVWQIWLKLGILRRPISPPSIDQFSKYLCLKISTLKYAQLCINAIFHLEHVFWPKNWYKNCPFFNFYFVTKSTKITISLKRYG